MLIEANVLTTTPCRQNVVLSQSLSKSSRVKQNTLEQKPTPQGQREKCPSIRGTTGAKVSFYPGTVLPWLQLNTSLLRKWWKLPLLEAFSLLKFTQMLLRPGQNTARRASLDAGEGAPIPFSTPLRHRQRLSNSQRLWILDAGPVLVIKSWRLWRHVELSCLGGAAVGVRLVIERSLVRLPAGMLSSQLGQLSLQPLWGR